MRTIQQYIRVSRYQLNKGGRNSMSVAFLFPGQGSQHPNMLHTLPDHPAIMKAMNEASEALGEDALSFDTEERLRSTIAVQVSLLISGVAAARMLQAEGVMVDMVGGHSVGAFGAAVISGALDFKDAVSLVKLRGELMEKAYPGGYGMGVVLGLHERQLTSIIEDISTPEAPVFIANLNSPDQITIAGAVSGIENVLASAHTMGARKAQLLDVSVPSHCPLLDSVSNQLAKALEHVPFHEPNIPYAGNRTARALRTSRAIREDLALSVSTPVRWHDATSLLFELGTRLYIEMPPGHVLTDLATYAFSNARSISISESGIESAIVLAKRENGR
jgi:malonate decarboxylase epsilon subunit